MSNGIPSGKNPRRGGGTRGDGNVRSGGVPRDAVIDDASRYVSTALKRIGVKPKNFS